MSNRSRGPGSRERRAAGFTLAEVLVVVAIILITALVGFPVLQGLLARARIQGIVQGTAAEMLVARYEAIKMGETVVVKPDFDADEILLFVNVDDDSDLEYSPDATQPLHTADYELARLRLPTDFKVFFWAPGDNDPEGRDVIDGFTPVASGPNVAVFLPDGSIRDEGAFRFGDERGNHFEVRVTPMATAKVQVLKYHRDPPWGDRPGFFPAGRHASGVPMWEWY